MTLGITYWAAQRTRTTKDFYAAGGGITGFQNGLAIAGDYMSAASFLGITALVYAGGYYGLIYSIGFLVGWPIIMFLMAEPLRNLGRFTFADVASYRLQATPIRAMAATGTLVTVAFYLIAQMVGAGQLIELLFGLPYLWAVVVVGVLMIIYVTFGGMIATTWVQIIKAGLLLGGSTLMALLVLAQFGFDFNALHRQGDRGPSEARRDPVARRGGRQSDQRHLARHRADVRHRRPAAHPDALLHRRQRQGSAQVGVLGDHLHRLLLHPDLHHRLRRDRAGARPTRSITSAATSRSALLGGGNMPAIHLAQAVGGDLMKGFIAAVAFATILAVVSGLTLSGASAVSHDLYASVFRRGNVDEGAEVRVSRITTVILGIVAIILGVVFEKINVAFMVGLAFAVAASANFPVLLLSMLWKGLTTRGAVIGGFVGLISARRADDRQPRHLGGGARLSEGLGAGSPTCRRRCSPCRSSFLCCWLFSVTDSSKTAAGGAGGVRGAIRAVADRHRRRHRRRPLNGQRAPASAGALSNEGALRASGRRRRPPVSAVPSTRS